MKASTLLVSVFLTTFGFSLEASAPSPIEQQGTKLQVNCVDLKGRKAAIAAEICAGMWPTFSEGCIDINGEYSNWKHCKEPVLEWVSKLDLRREDRANGITERWGVFGSFLTRQRDIDKKWYSHTKCTIVEKRADGKIEARRLWSRDFDGDLNYCKRLIADAE